MVALFGSGIHGRSMKGTGQGQQMKRLASWVALMFILVTLFTFIVIFWIDISFALSSPLVEKILAGNLFKKPPMRIEYSLECSDKGKAKRCNVNNNPYSNYHSPTFKTSKLSSSGSCPEYFRWIHEDLRPWKSGGISRDMMERAKGHAHFRLVIVKGKAYVERYSRPYQTRDMFTIWGILQLLRFYPGQVPDLDLMFRCGDVPVIMKQDYHGPNATSPPPLFHYSGNNNSLGIIFPDWTFWGWAETNLRPWNKILEDLKEANKRTNWKDRVPYAYWKGNPDVSPGRLDLMKCNVSRQHEWNARLYKQNWKQQVGENFKDSKIEDQCTHRYKIYIEGRAWSVSDKYILACDSTVLLVKPDSFDFFTRGLGPMQHYWHIRPQNKCRDIKFAVEWGNNHADKAEAIGKAGSKFIGKNLKMEYVYDYMLHALSEYAKLLKFKPTIPQGAVEFCPEKIACTRKGLYKELLLESMVKFPSEALPCAMPSPYKSKELEAFLDRKESILRTVEMWGNEYWAKFDKQ